MAFSFRKIISNINYFKKSDDDDSNTNDGFVDPNSDVRRNTATLASGEAEMIEFEHTEPDSTSKQVNVKNDSPLVIAAKKGSVSDPDITKSAKKLKRRSKKLKLNVHKANQSLDENLKADNHSDDSNSDNPENTPKHIFLESKSAEAFTERVRLFDFSTSFNIDSDDQSSPYEDNIDIQSLTDSDEDISIASQEIAGEIKMCRKVDEILNDSHLVPSTSPESFGDVEMGKNEEDRLTLLSSYQMKFDKMDCFLKNLLTEFQFHIEVSKIFNSWSIEQDNIVELKSIDKDHNRESSSNKWDIIIEKEDAVTKNKLKNQLLTIKHTIEQFVNTNLKNQGKRSQSVSKDHKKTVSKTKKKLKHYDFPDYREELINLFYPNTEQESVINVTMEEKCNCNCHDTSQADSGVTKSDDRSMSITSSIGNFSLDSSTLTAYSESLDQIISYNSFQDTSLYSTMLQKAAIERITFYVQVHSIQLKSEPCGDYESKNKIFFHCPSCNTTEYDENNLLKHILSQYHCEKLHFLYKTAYIKKCVQSGKEIQPSTVLNPMTLYRDDNKVVCFGDAMYACSLCFVNLIIGESILMAHCMEVEHIERREKLNELSD